MRPARFASDRRGTVAVTVTLVAACAMGCAALGIDIGALVRAKRSAQGAVDLAAMLAAVDPARAESLARRSLADNGFGDATIAIASGRYAANSGAAPTQRFQAGTGPVNAVRVDLTTKVRTSFAKVIGLPAEFEIGATGTAATTQMAAFSVGSGLVALDGGIANAVLGGLLGTRLSLSVMDYNALLSTTIDSYRFLDALGARLQLASFDQILDANVALSDVVLALKTANQAGSSSSASNAALDAILSAGPNGGRLKLGDLIDLGDAAALSPGKGSRGPDTAMMDILSAAAALANGQNQISVNLGAQLPGLLRTRLTLSIGERRQSSGWVQPGTPNATVRTAQTRLLLETELSAPLGLGTVYLPIYVQAAQAAATLRSTTCPWSQSNRRQVTIDAQPAVLDLAIANVTRSSISSRAPQPDLSRDAELIGLPLVSVTGKARATLGSAQPQPLVFSDDDITHRRIKSASSTGMTQSLTRSLLDTLSLNVAGLGLGAALRPALALVLAGVAPVLDTVLDTTLRTLGVKVGTVDVTVDGMRCDHAVLVQ